MVEQLNRLGAVVAIVFFLSAILVFVFRLVGKPQYGQWMGYLEFLLAIPLIYLLITAPRYQRPTIYTIQIVCILGWLAVSALLDYILKIEFRGVRWMVIAYVVLFFAGSGGLLGIASLAGRQWTIPAVALFLIMAVLAFVQRGVTGM
jgi:hypothetical protein